MMPFLFDFHHSSLRDIAVKKKLFCLLFLHQWKLFFYLEDIDIDSSVELEDGAKDRAEDQPDNTEDNVQVLTQIPR